MTRSIFDFEFNEEANICFIKHYGTVDLDALIKRQNATSKKIGNRRDVKVIMDFRNCTYALPPKDLRAYADDVGVREQRRGRYREAMIVDDKLGHAIVRPYSGMRNRSEEEYQIFKFDLPDLKREIQSWVGINEKVVFPDFLNL
mgnify:CR=1 FL=1